VTALSPVTNSSTEAKVVPLPALHFQLPPTTGTRADASLVEENVRVATLASMISIENVRHILQTKPPRPHLPPKFMISGRSVTGKFAAGTRSLR
jgi:hypothetical protein